MDKSFANICCLFTLSTNNFMPFMASCIPHNRVKFFLKTHYYFNASSKSISPICVTYNPKLQNQLPHHWKVHDFNPGSSFCDHCGSVLHGLKGQGLKCSCIVQLYLLLILVVLKCLISLRDCHNQENSLLQYFVKATKSQKEF